MDATKRMYIDEILKKTQYYDDFEYFEEVTGCTALAHADLS
jgi:hypothetical protein